MASQLQVFILSFVNVVCSTCIVYIWVQSDILAATQGPMFAYSVDLLGNNGSIVYHTFQGGRWLDQTYPGTYKPSRYFKVGLRSKVAMPTTYFDVIATHPNLDGSLSLSINYLVHAMMCEVTFETRDDRHTVRTWWSLHRHNRNYLGHCIIINSFQ